MPALVSGWLNNSSLCHPRQLPPQTACGICLAEVSPDFNVPDNKTFPISHVIKYNENLSDQMDKHVVGCSRVPVWYLFIMTSSNGNIFRVTALCAGNPPVTGEFPAQRPATRSFDVFYDLRLNKRMSKHSWGWWLETPPCLLWRHCYITEYTILRMLQQWPW